MTKQMYGDRAFKTLRDSEKNGIQNMRAIMAVDVLRTSRGFCDSSSRKGMMFNLMDGTIRSMSGKVRETKANDLSCLNVSKGLVDQEFYPLLLSAINERIEMD
ncbi:hypothetical protein ACOME3_006939 [Neoechinorhynchus agilis]